MTTSLPYWVAGRPATGDDRARGDLTARRPGRRTTTTATDAHVEQAVAAADAAAGAFAASPAHVRAAALDHVSAPARRARRGVRPADHRRERQAAEVGARLRWPARCRRSAGPPRRPAVRPARLQRLDTDPAAAGRLALVRRFAARPGARHRAVQLPAEPGRAQGRARRSRSARRSCSSRRRPRRCPRCCSASCWPRPTCPRARGRCCRCRTTAPALVAGPAAAGGLLHRLGAVGCVDPGRPCRAST